MSDLISRQALCEYALNQKDKSVSPNDIMRFPSAQPKTGKWTIKNGELAIWDVCSECGKMVIHKAPFYNFCPNCGARMLKEGEEHD